ncbi:MAG: amino acid ABC transporter substrate-binding protein [Alphaproteobacteria bacterium]|nr:amino acid ABC transporter substrate-binding protein [Alphaproteobacteria bacterium]
MTHKLFITIALLFGLCIWKESIALSPLSNQAAQKVAPDIQALKDKNKIIISTRNEDMFLFSMQDQNGQLTGVDMDLSRGIAQELGVELELNRQAQSFDDVVDLVASGKADLGISKLSLTLHRAERVSYSSAYVVMHQALLINRVQLKKLQEPDVKSIEDILKKNKVKIGVLDNSSYVLFAKKLFPNVDIIKYKSWENEIIPKVLDGTLFAAFYDEIEVKNLIKKMPDAALKLLAVILKKDKDPIMIICPWNKPHLLHWVNLYLQSTATFFTVDQLYKKYPELKK